MSKKERKKYFESDHEVAGDDDTQSLRQKEIDLKRGYASNSAGPFTNTHTHSLLDIGASRLLNWAFNQHQKYKRKSW
jgi:hypothetical protein